MEETPKPKSVETREPIPVGAIRQELGEFSVFKVIQGRKTFLGIRKTQKEANELYWSHK